MGWHFYGNFETGSFTGLLLDTCATFVFVEVLIGKGVKADTRF